MIYSKYANHPQTFIVIWLLQNNAQLFKIHMNISFMYFFMITDC